MRFFKFISIFTVIAFIIFVILSYIFANFFISANHHTVNLPSDVNNLEFVSFQTTDSINIKGWFTKSSDNKKAVVLLHGYKGDRTQMLPYAKILHEAGYNTLIYDARGCGESDGDMVSLGFYEQNDLIAAMKYLKTKGMDEIALYGYSQGGATAIMAADSLKDVKCIISEVAYDKMENAIDNRFRKFLYIPGSLGAMFMVPFAENKLGISLSDLEPVNEISKLHIPVFIIGGENDSRTIQDNTINLYEAANQPKELWMVPGAEHNEILEKDTDMFKLKVTDFLRRYL